MLYTNAVKTPHFVPYLKDTMTSGSIAQIVNPPPITKSILSILKTVPMAIIIALKTSLDVFWFLFSIFSLLKIKIAAAREFAAATMKNKAKNAFRHSLRRYYPDQVKGSAKAVSARKHPCISFMQFRL